MILQELSFRRNFCNWVKMSEPFSNVKQRVKLRCGAKVLKCDVKENWRYTKGQFFISVHLAQTISVRQNSLVLQFARQTRRNVRLRCILYSVIFLSQTSYMPVLHLLMWPEFFLPDKRPTRRDVWPSKRDGRNGLWCKTLCLLPGVESFFQRNVQVCLLQRGSVSVQVQVRFWLRVAIILRHSQNCK